MSSLPLAFFTSLPALSCSVTVEISDCWTRGCLALRGFLQRTCVTVGGRTRGVLKGFAPDVARRVPMLLKRTRLQPVRGHGSRVGPRTRPRFATMAVWNPALPNLWIRAKVRRACVSARCKVLVAGMYIPREHKSWSHRAWPNGANKLTFVHNGTRSTGAIVYVAVALTMASSSFGGRDSRFLRARGTRGQKMVA